MVRDTTIEKTKSSIPDRIKELELELQNTKYNKRTQGHIGLIKAKIARLKELQEQRRKGKGITTGYSVKKSGDATVIMIGFPSVGKSTILNRLTNAESKTAAYAFTTLTCIPGMLDYKSAKIQILDVPGVVQGAASGRGRGKEVLAVAMSADLVMFIIDIFNPGHYGILMKEAREFHLRINEKKADVKISKTSKGGINIYSTVRLTNIDQQTIKNILSEFRIPNADVIVRSDITADQLIDAIESNNKYIPGLIVVNKIDIATKEQIEEVKLKLRPDVFISAEQGTGIDELKEAIYRKLRFMRVYCKRQGYKADLDVPMIMHQGSTLKDMCERLHKDFVKKFRFARVWGSSKFPGQPIRKLSYEIKDGDIVELVIE